MVEVQQHNKEPRMEMLEERRCFEGWQQRWRHRLQYLKLPDDVQYLSPTPS
ncbi:hypothetical protein ACLB1S_20095 [Escherichia coli]